MIITREFCMPNSSTFQMVPVRNLLKRFCDENVVAADPFARDTNISGITATYTNDINLKYDCYSNVDAAEFGKELYQRRIELDLILFDPPYTIEQLKRSYESAGLEIMRNDPHKINRWTKAKRWLAACLKLGGVVISFGYSSYGFGKNLGFEIEEILLLNHGCGHYDTICTVERYVGV